MSLVRILQVIDNISEDSGVSTMVMNLYRNIDRTKVQFDFLVSCDNANRGKSYEEEIKMLGGRVLYFGAPLSKNIIGACKTSKKFFKENSAEYYAVHLHTPTIAYFTLRYAKKYGILNRIIHSHSTMTSTNKIKAIINRFLLTGIKYANNYWACSTEAAQFLYGESFCDKNNITLIYNAVDSKKFAFNEVIRDAWRDKMDLKEKIICVHVSNFTKIKNVFFLRNVIRIIANNRDNIYFVFVGDGETKSQFENEIKQTDLTKFCRFVGRTDDVTSYLNMADIFLLPSIKEGLPVSAIEAQANGLKCLLSESITRESIASEGIEFLPLDVSAWSDAIIHFSPYENKKRNDECTKFQTSVFDITREAKRVMELYLSI